MTLHYTPVFTLKIYCLLCSLAIFPSVLFSQHVDYIISLGNDTIPGSITKYHEDDDIILFKHLDDNDLKEYSPREIGGFSFEDKIYHSIVPPSKKYKEFYQVLILGNMDLLERNTSGKKQLVVAKNSKLFELDEDLRSSNNYIYVLKKLMIDRPEMFRAIDNLRYKKLDIQNVIVEYNTHSTYSNVQYVYISDTNPLGFSVEGSIHQNGIESSIHDDWSSSSSIPSLSLGFYADFLLMKQHEIQIGTRLTKFSGHAVHDYSLGELDFEFDHFLLTIPLQFNFDFSDNKFIPKLIIEGNWTIILSNDVHTENRMNVGGITNNVLLFQQKQSLGYALGAGVNLSSKYYLELKYSKNNFKVRNAIIPRRFKWEGLSLSIGYRLGNRSN